jgi:hypothetical protein
VDAIGLGWLSLSPSLDSRIEIHAFESAGLQWRARERKGRITAMGERTTVVVELG